MNGLAQTLLKLTVPGVPDFYQGTEFWDQSLVDPDNRRPVDFEVRLQALEEPHRLSQLASHWCDGLVKQALIERVLDWRRRLPDLFARGDYRPLQITGPRASHAMGLSAASGMPRWSWLFRACRARCSSPVRDC